MKQMTLDFIKVENSDANPVEGLWDTASLHANVKLISTNEECFSSRLSGKHNIMSLLVLLALSIHIHVKLLKF